MPKISNIFIKFAQKKEFVQIGEDEEIKVRFLKYDDSEYLLGFN